MPAAFADDRRQVVHFVQRYAAANVALLREVGAKLSMRLVTSHLQQQLGQVLGSLELELPQAQPHEEAAEDGLANVLGIDQPPNLPLPKKIANLGSDLGLEPLDQKPRSDFVTVSKSSHKMGDIVF